MVDLQVAESRTYEPPQTDIDVFDPAILTDPWPAYRELRNLGAVVYFRKYGVYALTRYQVIRDSLRQPYLFCSNEGVAFNAAMNEAQKPTILGMDGPEHRLLRSVLTPLLSSRSLKVHIDRMAELATELVAGLRKREQFDGVRELAQLMPISIGLDIIGLPKGGRRRHMISADLNFNAFGPLTPDIEVDLQRLNVYLAKMDTFAASLTPGSLGAAIMEEAEKGTITRSQARGLLQTVMLASLDTTARSLTSVLYHFAVDPDQWAIVKQDPALIPNAFNEVIRFDGPSLSTARTVAADTIAAGYFLPKGARVAMMFASGNRDENRWEQPDRFDVRREDANESLTFGHGVHYCVGHVLARMQSAAVLSALVEQVDRLILTGKPRRRLSSVIRGFEYLPMRLA